MLRKWRVWYGQCREVATRTEAAAGIFSFVCHWSWYILCLFLNTVEMMTPVKKQWVIVIVLMWSFRHGQCKRGVGNLGGSPRTKVAAHTAILVGIGRPEKREAGNHVLISLAKSPLSKLLTNPSSCHFFLFFLINSFFTLSQKGFIFILVFFFL